LPRLNIAVGVLPGSCDLHTTQALASRKANGANIGTPRAYFGVVRMTIIIFSDVSYLIQSDRKFMYLAVKKFDKYTNNIILDLQRVNIVMATSLVPKETQFFGTQRLWGAFGTVVLAGWVGMVIGVLRRNYLNRSVFGP